LERRNRNGNSEQLHRDSNISILVVGASVKASVRSLALRGASLTLCPDAKCAVQMLKEGSYQVVLCHLDGPWTRTKRFLGLVSKEFPEVALVPVTKPHDLRMGMLAMISGASGYLLTRIEPRTLVPAVRNALKRKRLEAAVSGLPHRRLQKPA
jgi:DNA-binding NtrC family response regulator